MQPSQSARCHKKFGSGNPRAAWSHQLRLRGGNRKWKGVDKKVKKNNR